MKYLPLLLILTLFLPSCVDPISFSIKNNVPGLVVESWISDKSYNETVNYPSDGRYFYTKLSWTSDVTNQNDKPVTGARVVVVNDQGQEWPYVESVGTQGTYLLNNPSFKAKAGHTYQLQITLDDGRGYSSDWESLPDNAPEDMGDITFEEVTNRKYVYEAEQRIIKDVSGIDVKIHLSKNEAGSPIYYKWDFEPIWIFIASLTTRRSPLHECWVRSQYYLRDYVLQTDLKGDYDQKLFFIESYDNERIFQKLSVLIKQYELNEGYYNFLNELQSQTGSPSGLHDATPFNLSTNIHASGPDSDRVNGYFGVIREKAKRWYFDKFDLSYPVEDLLKESCQALISPGPPPNSCLDCEAYSGGTSINIRPVWWNPQ